MLDDFKRFLTRDLPWTYHGVRDVYHGVREVYHGVREVYPAVSEVYNGAREVYNGVREVCLIGPSSAYQLQHIFIS